MIASLVLLGWVASAGAEEPGLGELRAEASRRLESYQVPEASALVARGLARAAEEKDLPALRAFEVLRAEVMVQDRHLRDALRILEGPLQDADPLTRARAAMARGVARCIGGEDERKSQADLDEAERLVAGLGLPLQAQLLLRRGTCAMVKSRLGAAERDFQRVLAIARAERLGPLAAMAEGSLGMVAVKAGRLDEGVRWLERSLAASERLGARTLSLKTRGNLGWCYYELGDYHRTLATLAPLVEHPEILEPDRWVVLNHLGNASYRLERLAEARKRYEQALELARRLGHPQWEAQQLDNLALLAFEERKLDLAERQIQAAAGLWERSGDQAGLASATLMRGLIAAERGAGAEALRLLREVARSPGAEAVVVLEARAALARMAVAAGRRREAEAEYRETFRLMERTLSQVQAAENRLSFLASLRRFQDEYVDFLVDSGREDEALEASDRSRARVLRERLGAAAAPVRAADLRALAARLDAVLLAYWVGPKRGHLWVISRQAARRAELPGREELKRNIQAHQRVILSSRDPVAEGTRASRWLYDALLKPAALAPGTRVVAALDGALHGLSLETLVVPGPPPHYWIEDATLTLVPALGLLRSGKPGAGAPRRALLLGDALPSPGFPPLPQAGQELRAIAALFGPPEGTLLAGAGATPEAWGRAEPGRYGFIHLAAHAEANPLSPLDSAVVLSPRGDAPYKLYARDVAAARLEAELVTLSACHGAGARAYAGEGLVGLAWAFLQSGAANVVGGLWDVEDTSTAEVMEGLYRNVLGHAPPAEALRAAKLALLRSGTARRKPYYWGPLVMVTRRPSPGAVR